MTGLVVGVVLVLTVLIAQALLKKRKKRRKKPKKKQKNKGSRYEQKVAEKLRRKGYTRVEVSGKSGDYGADVKAVDPKGRKVVVQCKCYSGNVGYEAVQEIHAAKDYFHAERAIVATNSRFTAQAKNGAKRLGVELWENYCK